MIEYICDKCGDRIPHINEITFLSLKRLDTITKLTLCQKCDREIEAFIGEHTGVTTLSD